MNSKANIPFFAYARNTPDKYFEFNLESISPPKVYY